VIYPSLPFTYLMAAYQLHDKYLLVNGNYVKNNELRGYVKANSYSMHRCNITTLAEETEKNCKNPLENN
jgi:hypothetical protein